MKLSTYVYAYYPFKSVILCVKESELEFTGMKTNEFT